MEKDTQDILEYMKSDSQSMRRHTMTKMPELPEALDIVYGHNRWNNPIRPYFVSGCYQTAYEAYQELKPEYQRIVMRLIGHEPQRGE